jgi:hypothetical protein
MVKGADGLFEGARLHNANLGAEHDFVVITFGNSVALLLTYQVFLSCKLDAFA